jgi:GST-like protein
MIDLYYWPTPNGKKVTILLEECAMPYEVVVCNIAKGDQFTENFLRICPNNRMPALVDRAPTDGGEPVSVFESGAMMMYLAEKAGQDVRGKYAATEWVMWQMANQGPKSGECGHFRRLGDSQGDQSYAVTRFTDEVNRFYGVLNQRLYDCPYLAGDAYSIADMIVYPWCAVAESQGQDINEFKHVKRWFDELSARPAVQRGMAVGSELAFNLDTMSEDEKAALRKMLYNQRARPVVES